MKLTGLFSLIFSVLITPVFIHAQVVSPDPATPISPLRKRAATIYQRLTGLKLGIDAPILVQMEERLAAGNPLGAAALVTGDNAQNIAGDPAFYDIVVRQMTTKMSNREESVRAPLNDFVATFTGTIRDERDARELLQGNYIYRPASALRKANGDPLEANILTVNTAYTDLQTLISQGRTTLRDGIERVETQQSFNGTTGVNNPDPAGLLTTRAWGEAHAIAGTNRRMVHFSFKQFLCIDMEGWATTDSPSDRVGMDVERAPGGDPNTFEKTCKGCHGNMDGLRGAFAHLHFDDGVLKHGLVLTNQDSNGLDADNAPASRFPRARLNNISYPGIAAKYIRAADAAPNGYITTDASWINTATKGANATYFGWRTTPDSNGNIRGYGVNQYGRMLANSEAFSRCMVKRVYAQVCKRQVSTFESDFVRAIAGTFESENYNMKKLFQRVATHDACIGK